LTGINQYASKSLKIKKRLSGKPFFWEGVEKLNCFLGKPKVTLSVGYDRNKLFLQGRNAHMLEFYGFAFAPEGLSYSTYLTTIQVRLGKLPHWNR